MSKQNTHLADQKDLSAILESFYALGRDAPGSAELAYVGEIDQMSGMTDGFPDMMGTLSKLIAGLHSFQPVSLALQEELDRSHEVQILGRIHVHVDEKQQIAATLHAARRENLTGVAEEFPDCFIELGIPDFAMLQSYWRQNVGYIHPIVLASETARHTGLPTNHLTSILVGLEAFRQIGMPLVLELPLDLEHKIGSHRFNDGLQAKFGQIMIYSYENVRKILAQILTLGPSAHNGSGNAFALLRKGQ